MCRRVGWVLDMTTKSDFCIQRFGIPTGHGDDEVDRWAISEHGENIAICETREQCEKLRDERIDKS